MKAMDCGSTDRSTAWALRTAVVVCLAAAGVPQTAFAAVPIVAQAGAGLVAPDLANAAKPAAAGQAAPAPAAAEASPPAKASGSGSLMKYAPSYVLMLLLIGLGTFIICRPRSWPGKKADKK